MKLTLRQPGSHRYEELTSSTLFQACPRGPTSFLLGCRPEISISSRDQIFNRGQHCREVPRQHPSASFVGAAATATAEARSLSSWFPGCPCPESRVAVWHFWFLSIPQLPMMHFLPELNEPLISFSKKEHLMVLNYSACPIAIDF